MRQPNARFAARRLVWKVVAVAALMPPASTPAQLWEEITPAAGPTPSARRNAAAIYDPIDHQIILFGGRSSSGDEGDLWRFDLSAQAWEQVATGTGPVPRFTHNAVYDVASRRMIVWSGRKVDADGQELFSDVWAFDIERSEWSLLQPSVDLPQRRYGTAAVYDPLSHSLVNFAGFTLEGRFDDTWRFDLAGASWEELKPSGNPGARCLHTATYDARRGRMVIFGGQRGGDALGDTWALDLSAGVWEELSSTTGPGGRKFAASVYDAGNDRFLVLGGDTGTAKDGGVWSLNLDDATWEEVRPEGEAPAARDGAVAVFVAAEQRLILFGGTGDEHLNDLWSLSLPAPDQTAVEVREPAVAPAASTLGQNYPNPFNGRTVIPFRIGASATAHSGDPVQVHLVIYDVLGRRVRELTTHASRPGDYQLPWHGDDDEGRPVGSGSYFCQLSTPGVLTARKLLLAR